MIALGGGLWTLDVACSFERELVLSGGCDW